MLARTIPHSFRVARPKNQTWDGAVRTLDRLDPQSVLTSPLPYSLLREGKR